MTLRFELDALTGPTVQRHLAEHLEDMYSTSPAESVHALDLAALRSPEIEFWTAWQDDELRATGALKRLSATAAELTSMRTARAARGSGIGTGSWPVGRSAITGPTRTAPSCR